MALAVFARGKNGQIVAKHFPRSDKIFSRASRGKKVYLFCIILLTLNERSLSMRPALRTGRTHPVAAWFVFPFQTVAFELARSI
jgi:hypothetical protein